MTFHSCFKNMRGESTNSCENMNSPLCNSINELYRFVCGNYSFRGNTLFLYGYKNLLAK